MFLHAFSNVVLPKITRQKKWIQVGVAFLRNPFKVWYGLYSVRLFVLEAFLGREACFLVGLSGFKLSY